MKYALNNNGKVNESGDISVIFNNWKQDKEVWLFVGPHDDDIVLGAGLLLQAGLKEGAEVYALITTDGSMGYCKPEQKDTIAAVRKKETLDSFKIIGLPESNVFYADFPDCNLNSYIGRRKAVSGDSEIEGFTGLQNAFTYFLRKVVPNRVILPTGHDLHPDHKIVYQEFLISMFHASGNIWPELGKALPQVPTAYECAIYCDFPTKPEIKIEADDDIFKKKLDSILAYQSQEQIAQLVETQKNGGPYEFFRKISFDFYNPKNYISLFEG